MRNSKDRKHSQVKAWEWFSKALRLEAADTNGYVQCYTCSTIKFWKEIGIGHYFPQGVNKGLKFDERNCHPQENSCNSFKHGNLAVYAQRLVKQYGPTILDLLAAKRAMKIKIDQSGFELMAEQYKERALKAAKQRGLSLETNGKRQPVHGEQAQ